MTSQGREAASACEGAEEPAGTERAMILVEKVFFFKEEEVEFFRFSRQRSQAKASMTLLPSLLFFGIEDELGVDLCQSQRPLIDCLSRSGDRED